MNQLVFVENGQAVTDSLTIAGMFGKEHKNVLRDIQTQIEHAGPEFSQLNFEQAQYQHQQNKQIYPKYNLTEEAFTLVVMSYNTREAVQTKIKFIQEFKRMREQLSKQPQTQLEILQASINQLVEQEHRLSAVETRLVETEKKQEQITEVLSLNPVEWRKKVNSLINRIAKQRGGFEAFGDVRNESYQSLEERAKCRLSVKLKNRKGRASLEGVAKSKIDKMNYMDVIADDARLTEIYLAIVKEMAIKHNVGMESA